LSSQREVDFHELQDEAFVLFPEGATIRTTFDQLAAAHGVQPKVSFVTTDTDRMREMVALGLGIGLLPLSDANRPGPHHATVLIRGQPLAYVVYLARRSRRRQSPAAIAMNSLIESTFGGAAGSGVAPNQHVGTADDLLRPSRGLVGVDTPSRTPHPTGVGKSRR
jgi:DNA-binding transcriptional LysR family regulator